jgi:hypothetical protein
MPPDRNQHTASCSDTWLLLYHIMHFPLLHCFLTTYSFFTFAPLILISLFISFFSSLYISVVHSSFLNTLLIYSFLFPFLHLHTCSSPPLFIFSSVFFLSSFLPSLFSHLFDHSIPLFHSLFILVFLSSSLSLFISSLFCPSVHLFPSLFAHLFCFSLINSAVFWGMTSCIPTEIR